jgi:carotenoid cleavage dioxygenase-like enzyme
MPVLFPAHPGFRGPMAPQRMECDLFELEYDGTLPPALEGSFYRCGPDPQFPPTSTDDFFINGDGIVSMFRFQGGHVDFRMRYVRTDKFKLERAARRALFGGYRNPYTDDPSVASADRTTANTAIFWYHGALYAIKEDGLPHRLDPDTLETLGKLRFEGQRTPHFTAHPKFDPQSGEMIFYGTEAAGLATPDIAYCEADGGGRLVHEAWFKAPYASMVHDFAVTERYVIFPIMPTVSDHARMQRGGSHFAWDDARETWLAVLPRKGRAEDVRYFRGPGRWSFHTLNAFDVGSKIQIDLTVSEINGFSYLPNTDGKPWDPERARSYLTRWTCDLAGTDERFTETRLWDVPADFFKCDPRRATQRYRIGFMAAKDPTRPRPAGAPDTVFNTLAAIDHASGTVTSFFVGPDATVQEPEFVPRSAEAAEGDGWLLAVVNRVVERRAELVVLDTADLAAGPVATVRVPVPLRMTFHGEFVDAATLGWPVDSNGAGS